MERTKFSLGIIGVVLACLTVGVLSRSAKPAQAASQYVTDFSLASNATTSLRLCWTTAALPNVSPTVFATTGEGDNATSVPVTLSDLTRGDTWCGTVSSLQENTPYRFWVEYVDTSLSGYTDYVSGKVVSVTYAARTVKSDLNFSTVDKKYVMAGERIRLYGTGFGTAPSSLTGLKGYLVAQSYLGTASPEGLTTSYAFPVTAWKSNYLELVAPAYDATKTNQIGKIYLPFLIPSGYDSLITVKMIANDSQVDRAILSGYTGAMYRFLLNASTYRYNMRRTSATHGQEELKMRLVADYLKSRNRGIDATWSLVLSYGGVYGGYSDDEIKHEIMFGPGCIHAYIPQAVWSQTADYARCMNHLLP